MRTDKEYLALCESVEKQALRIIGLAGAGRSDDAGRAAAAMLQEVGTRKQQFLMQQEQTGSYDLGALRVNADTPSNSETGWEKED